MRVLIIVLLSIAHAGCALHTVAPIPSPPVELPAAFSASDDAGDEPQGPWWNSFGEPRLSQTIESALRSNRDLLATWARVKQAAIVARQTGAGWWPQVEASVGVGLTQTSLFFGDEVSSFIDSTVRSESFPMSVGMKYEVDLWGRVRSLTNAAAEDGGALEEDGHALAVTLSAQVAEAWFGLGEQQELDRLLEEQLGVASTYQELVEARFQQGLASALDVRQQRQQVSGLKAQIPLARARREALSNQLSILMGQPPGGEHADQGSLPDLPVLPRIGVPSTLLQWRPDLRAARRRVTAADHRVGVAIADRFPALRLGASTGFQDRDISQLFTNWVWSLAANVVAPLFDGGKRAAEVDRTRAVLEERLHQYGAVVLRALGEVEDALSGERRQREHLDALAAQLGDARATLEEARRRYVAGLVDYLPVLTALQSVQQVERQIVAARRQLLSYRVQLSRALGGAWGTPPQVKSAGTGHLQGGLQ